MILIYLRHRFFTTSAVGEVYASFLSTPRPKLEPQENPFSRGHHEMEGKALRETSACIHEPDGSYSSAGNNIIFLPRHKGLPSHAIFLPMPSKIDRRSSLPHLHLSSARSTVPTTDVAQSTMGD